MPTGQVQTEFGDGDHAARELAQLAFLVVRVGAGLRLSPVRRREFQANLLCWWAAPLTFGAGRGIETAHTAGIE